MEVSIKLGERLTELMRDSDNMTAMQFASSMGVAIQTVSRWRHGTRQMNLSYLIKAANILNCTLDYLIGRNESILDFVPQECPKFYDRLRKVMEEQNVSWYRLTKETSIKDSYLYLWKKGSDVKISALLELADYFDVTIDYLVGRER